MESNADQAQALRPERKRRGTAVALLSVAGLTLAGSTAGLALSHRSVRRELVELRAKLGNEHDLRAKLELLAQDLGERIKQVSAENETLRTESRYREEVLEMESEARKKAEKALTKERGLRETAEKKAEEAEQRALHAEGERDQERQRASALEESLTRLKHAEQEASKKNLGDAYAVLARLEEKLPEHVELEGLQRRVWLRYDCSLLRRLQYDLNDGEGEEAEGARARRDGLEERYGDACGQAQ